MLEQLFQWPTSDADQTVPDLDDSVFYPTEDLFQDDSIYATDTDQQALSDSLELVSFSRQNSMSETQDAISQWEYIPYDVSGLLWIWFMVFRLTLATRMPVSPYDTPSSTAPSPGIPLGTTGGSIIHPS